MADVSRLVNRLNPDYIIGGYPPGAPRDFVLFQPAYAQMLHSPTLYMMIPAQTAYSWAYSHLIEASLPNPAKYNPQLGNYNLDNPVRAAGFPAWDRAPHVSPLSNWGNRFSMPRGGRS